MRFSLATSFDDGLIDAVKDLSVDEIYGRVENDGFGGGRPRYLVPKVGWSRLERHVEKAREAGIGFNYLLNSADGGTGRGTRGEYSRLVRLLGRLEKMGVKGVTVVSPYVLRVVKERSGLSARVSVFARVDDRRKVARWLDEGADRVMLDSMLVNRDPVRLSEIVNNSPPGSVEILLNNRCEISCPFSACHAVDLGRASRDKAPAPDIAFLICQARFLSEPWRLLTQDWIRPEDLSIYTRMGFERFKIAGRGLGTKDLIIRARAYHEGTFDGNLMDLLRRGRIHLDPVSAFFSLLKGPRHLLSLRRIARIAGGIEDSIRIENRALDGFLDLVMKTGGCASRRCEVCETCKTWAKRAVSVDPGPAEETARLAGDISSGALFIAG